MTSYSGFSLFRHSLSGHRHWPRAWQKPRGRKNYDVVIIGAGGHGLATAYYLARDHGIRNIAVLEKKGILGVETRAEIPRSAVQTIFILKAPLFTSTPCVFTRRFPPT